ncbi:uncharacterized protein LOC113515490 isoform X2 [Galleria mellonella]|uniref:Uncharacterized protein LOC113515490 isoform X2 n=1 Tax=Galleria mellonella TaxID=7137 RepID=A0ABM3MXV8_GALME|nr:uncharacterized protein LOC113515490 isoform X2 [Galleria mellonella]
MRIDIKIILNRNGVYKNLKTIVTFNFKEYEEESGSESDGVSIEYIDEDKDAYIVSIKQEFLDELKKESKEEPEEIPSPPAAVYKPQQIKQYKRTPIQKKQVKQCSVPMSEVKIEKVDEIQIFANKMAERLRRLPLDKALELQVEIQTLVAKERIDMCTEEEENNTNQN